MEQIDVSIIIVNFNTSRFISQCLESIYKETKSISFEIIVVDNNSQEEDKKNLYVIRQNLFFNLIELSENVGFGRANNKGLEIAQGRNIFFLNPDTILVTNAVSELSLFLDTNSKCGACGGNLYDEKFQPTHSYNIHFPGFLDEFDQASKRLISRILCGKSGLFNYSVNNREVAFITGADLMVKKNVLDKIGGFNPIFFMYYEDTELQYRIKRAGYTIHNLPWVKIIHLEGKSFVHSASRERRILSSRKLYFSTTHRRIYCRLINKNYYIITKIGYLVSILLRKEEMKKKLSQRLTIYKELY